MRLSRTSMICRTQICRARARPPRRSAASGRRDPQRGSRWRRPNPAPPASCARRMSSSRCSAASHPAHTDGFPKLADVGDAVAREGVDHEPAVVGRRHLDRVDVTRQDPVVVIGDVVDDRQLEGQAGILLHVDHPAELLATSAFCRSSTTKSDEAMRKRRTAARSAAGVRIVSSVRPPVRLPPRNSLSGR